jgi:ketose-bisphosphate aldolase
MSKANMRELLRDAKKRNYAVPNLWGTSMEMLLGQIRAAEELRAPLSICVNLGLCRDMPLGVGLDLINSAAYHATVPVATCLDHGEDWESCVRSIGYGVSAVMYDGSSLPYEENVKNTAEIARVARTQGVAMEGELGAVGGSAAEWEKADEVASTHTDPALVADFVKRTGVDALAISFGNRHGLYKGKPDLRFDLVRRIGEIVHVPLVMHGASDLPDEVYAKVVESGISKVHFWSGPAKLAAQNLRSKLNEHAGDSTPIGYREVFEWNVDFFYEITKRMLTLLNCAGKA